MAPAPLLAGMLVVVALEVAVAALVIGHGRFLVDPRGLFHRLRESVPYLGVLVVTMLVGSAVRGITPGLSWIIGINITPLIYSIEGNAVGVIQSVSSPTATAYFSFIYVFGYPFLLVFPFLLYLTAEDATALREVALAYVFNDLFGLTGYALFVSYGPRNTIPGVVEPVLYATYPWTRLITASVNANTNVFPSLHTSLAVTVAVMAWRTRSESGRWWYLAAVVAASIVFATMYLGIHWVVDVVAGVLLGWGAVWLAARTVAGDYLADVGTALRRLPG